MTNFIIGKLPTTLLGLPIDTNFKTWIVVEQMLENPLNMLGDVLTDIVNLIFKENKPADYEQAFLEAMDFLNMYEEAEETREITDEPLFDWATDDIKVYSAFMRTYGINLRQVDYMHIWEFKALMQDLDEECLLNKAKHYRSLNLNDYEGKQKEELRKAKRYFEIK